MSARGRARVLARELAAAGTESPGLCARLLVERAAGIPRERWLFADERELTPAEEEALRALADRRLRGEPMAYILGRREFYEHEFVVDPATLIPRPETELLVELASRLAPGGAIFADLGCGCGCVGLSLLAIRRDSRGFLLDNSPGALKVARINDARLNTGATLVLGDIFALPFAPSSLDLIVANPPYVATEEEGEVCAETLAYEPRAALFSPEHGFAHALAIIRRARDSLRPGGWLLLEHGYRQQERILAELSAAGFGEIAGYRDLAGLPRYAAARKINS